MKWKLKEKKKIKLKGSGEKTMHEKLIMCEKKISQLIAMKLPPMKVENIIINEQNLIK